MGFIPLFVDLRGFKVLVVGGGYVGAKRALFFREAGAIVTVAAKEFREELRALDDIKLVEVSLPEDMDKLTRLIRDNDLIVIAVSDEELAEKIASVALAERKLVNNSVDHNRGNIIVPFRAVVEGLGVAVTSFGASGMAARLALERAVAAIREDQVVKAVLYSFGKLKKQLREAVKDPKLRMKIYLAIEEDNVYNEYIRRGDASRAYERALEIAERYGVRLKPLDDDISYAGE